MIEFFVPGVPRPGGSKKAFYNKKTGRTSVVDTNARSKDWRASVALAAAGVFSAPLAGALDVLFEFHILRPRGHYAKSGSLRNSAPAFPTSRPDVLKLTRSTEDALSGIAFFDDSQIVFEKLAKIYSSRTGVRIVIRMAEMEKTHGK
jgi:Holliday junction resolvase RusA-like endonuclease